MESGLTVLLSFQPNICAIDQASAHDGLAVGICQVLSLRFSVLIRGFDNHSLESKKSKIINITTRGNGFSIIAPPVKFKRSFQ